ncbi:MAG: SDR family NAD(P)-dependent oxidoreductase [Bacteroidota bacterium]
MKDITCLVTGATSGLGYAMASQLAKTGATVVMMARNTSRGQKARVKLIKESHNPNIDLIEGDLASLDSIKNFTKTFKRNYYELNVLANCAGIQTPKRRVSVDGYELNFATNILGPFVLTELLLDLMLESGRASIINVSGEAHRVGHIYFNDLELKKKITLKEAKGQTALARVMWTFELARRLARTNVTANTFSPGKTQSSLYRHYPLPLKMLKKVEYKLFGKSSNERVKPVVDYVLEEGLYGASGKYLEQGKVAASIPLSCHRGLNKRLWRTCERMIGLDGYATQVIGKRTYYKPSIDDGFSAAY